MAASSNPALSAEWITCVAEAATPAEEFSRWSGPAVLKFLAHVARVLTLNRQRLMSAQSGITVFKATLKLPAPEF
eukprot:4891315-Amphidinium_carterae.1